MYSPKASTSIVLQERDRLLLEDLYASRLMTLQQAAALHFNDRSEMAKKRIGRLKRAGYLRERPRKVSEPSILHLTLAGWRWLQTHGHLDEYPVLSEAAFERRSRVSDQTLKHEIAIMDIKASVSRAAASAANLKLLQFCTWPRLLEFSARSVAVPSKAMTVKPDGFVRFREVARDGVFGHSFFLELDRSSETQQTLVSRISAYLDFYRSGGFARRQGGQPEQYKEFPFRVLVVCLSDERKLNLLRRLVLHDPPIRTFALATTLSSITGDPLGTIWSRPLDVSETSSGDVGDASEHSLAHLSHHPPVNKINLFQ